MILSSQDFEKRFQNLSLPMICREAVLHGCSAASSADSSTGCLAKYDKDYVFRYCLRNLILFNESLQCSSMSFSTITKFTFRKRCSTESRDDDGEFESQTNTDRQTSRPNVKCWDGTTRRRNPCHSEAVCSYGEDQFLCGQEGFDQTFYRAEKQDQVQQTKKNVQLPVFPVDSVHGSTSNRSTTDQVNTSTSTEMEGSLPVNLPFLLNSCNRGISMWTHNRSRVCFCPPQYHGDQCQFHSDRMTFLTHVDYTHSDYTQFTDRNIAHKFLVLLLDDNQVISMDEFHTRPAADIPNYRKKMTYLHYSRSAQHMKKKQERYFNRSNIVHEHPFSIRIEAFELQSTRRPRRFAVWRYPIFFDYLPVHRLATVLRFLPLSDDDPCRRASCGRNEQCYRVQNHKSQYICLCMGGFFGENCSQIDLNCNSSYCSSNAICQPLYRGLVNGQDLPYCICPSGYTGQRCALLPDKCLDKPCQNSGTCSQRSKPNEYSCLCTAEYQGSICDKPKPPIHLQLQHNTTVAYQVIVVQYLKIDFVALQLSIASQQVYSHLPHNLSYLHATSPVPEIVLLKLYLAERSDIYLLSLLMGQSSIRTNTSITEYNRCQPAQSFFVTDQRSVIRYHHVCRAHPGLLCFFDDIYLCICEQNRSRAECFNYDHTSDKCHRCLANGSCVEGRDDHQFRCICPSCHEGRFCQFDLESTLITLDQLFYVSLVSSNPFISNLTYYSLIVAPLLLLLVGLVNNLCCFVTFRRRRCLRNGIGHYLYAMSICNQLTLAFLALRLIHLAVNISASHLSLSVDGVLCKVSNFLLTASTRLIYWLSSLVAVERVYVALFVNGQWLNKPHIAQRIIALSVVTIFGVSAYQLLLTHLPIDRDDVNNVLCSVTFPTSSSNWLRPRGPVTVFDSVGPFLINLVCTVSLICLVTKKRMNATGGRSPQFNVAFKQKRLHLLRSVLTENKELVIGPAFTLVPQLFSLPYVIASLMLQCQSLQHSGLRSLLIVSYFTTFIPPLMSFRLYISPSSFYTKEWQATSIGKWPMMFKRLRRRVRPA